MEIIISHTNTDFDSLAAMVAAQKLYPQAKIVITGSLDQSVKSFMAIHKDWIKVYSSKDIDVNQIKRLIIVDTQAVDRLGDFKEIINNPLLDIHIYDHHPTSYKDLVGNLNVVKEVGSTTTILVDIIKERGFSLTSLEATLFALGIYVDTGSLTFTTTTPEDAEAIAFLLSQGANLSLISTYIYHSLSEEQRDLLNQLILSSRLHRIHGFNIIITKAQVDKYIDELALLTRKLIDLERIEAVFSIVLMKDRIYVVGRSRITAIDVGSILAELGGAGHSTAASATIKSSDIEKVEKKLWQIINRKVRPVVTAEDIMSSPVYTINEEEIIENARKEMLRYGHSGMMVMDSKGRLTGIISRRDIDKALHHGYGHAPIRAYMNKNVIIASPQTSLPEIKRMMIEYDIGRIPVVENGNILGIVTRTDVIKAMGIEDYRKPILSSYIRIEDLSILPPHIQDLLFLAGAMGDELNMQVFAVGGFVRDLLLGVENLDIDIVVEGDGILFAKKYAERLYGRCITHEEFNTAVIILPDGFKLDVATARAEFYARPAALPEVVGTSIKQDLYRRDFSINAMAIKLNKSDFGRLIDFFGGQRDIQHGVISVLHNLSFIEDPTRIFRAIRFEQRYNFRMEHHTEKLLKEAIACKIFEEVANERVRDEIIQILSEENPIPAIKRMERLKVLPLIHSQLKADKKVLDILEEIFKTLIQYRWLIIEEKLEKWIIYFTGLVSQLSMEDLEEIAQKFKVKRLHMKKLNFDRTYCNRIIKILGSREEMSPSRVTTALKSFSLEIVLYILSRAKNIRARMRISNYIKEWRKVKPIISGNDIKELGISPGPVYKKILEEIRGAQLDGYISTRQQALEYIQEKYLQKDSEVGQEYVKFEIRTD